MKLCLNEATTLENSTLKTDLELCEKHGYDFIEIRTMDKLPEYLTEHSLEELAAFFESHHVKPLALNALVFFNNLNEAEHEAMLQTFSDMLEIARALHVPYIVAVPLVTKQPIQKQVIRESCVSVLQQLAAMAEPYGVRVALEFVGHPECTVNTFADAYQIVKEVDHPSVGLVFDCFHFHAMGSRLEDLNGVNGEKVFIVHIDDTEDFPIGTLRDEHRVWPGEGAIDLKGQFQKLEELGYEGPVSVELFCPDYYKLPPEETVRKAKETTLQVLARLKGGVR